MQINQNELKTSAEVRYKQAVLELIAKSKELRPLPDHLDYMVSIVNRLSATPAVLYMIVPNVKGARTEEALAYIEATLPAQMDLPDGVRWVTDQIETKGLDLREALKPEDLRPPIEGDWSSIRAENPGH